MRERVRARVRYQASSGLAAWSRDQMAVRYDQADPIREGERAEEPPANGVRDLGDGTELFVCDLPLRDESLAVDTVNTLAAASVFAHALPLLSGRPSWVEHHVCDHDDDPARRKGCAVTRREVAGG